MYNFSQLQQAEDTLEAKMEDVDEIREEFTMRLTESEQKLNQVLRVIICLCLLTYH